MYELWNIYLFHVYREGNMWKKGEKREREREREREHTIRKVSYEKFVFTLFTTADCKVKNSHDIFC